MHVSMPPPTQVYREYIAAGGLAAGKFVRADTNGIAAGAVDFLSREEAGFGFGVAPAMGAFDYKFGHFFTLSHYKVSAIIFKISPIGFSDMPETVAYTLMPSLAIFFKISTGFLASSIPFLIL